MRHKNETATSFDKLRGITQAIQAQKNSAQKLANANISALKPTKRAFTERQTLASVKEIKRSN
ncbi:hypothetical protein ACM29_07790 [Helicobacter pylori]|uniref:hypothetical protein n=1 Tax=Helicobacter pylori TaxID=210 RepID=UPI000682DD41|nr:hypothetical protein [Helicobacter pylori]KNE12037.1 hypothetical protein ACM29_07790 [Helicobacter pylori]